MQSIVDRDSVESVAMQSIVDRDSVESVAEHLLWRTRLAASDWSDVFISHRSNKLCSRKITVK